MRKHIVFSGSVQGVGFRYRACHAAQLYGVTGWIRNNWDGTVEGEFQGTSEDIDRVIMAIEQGTFVRIENFLVKAVPEEENERSFRIK